MKKRLGENDLLEVVSNLIQESSKYEKDYMTHRRAHKYKAKLCEMMPQLFSGENASKKVLMVGH